MILSDVQHWKHWHWSALAFLLGAMSVLGFAPFGLFPLPVIALALLFLLWQRCASPRHAAWLGFCYGFGFFLAGVSWVYVSLHDVGGMAAPLAALATLLFCAFLALFPALAAYASRRLATVDFFANALLFAGIWAITEWLRGWVLTGFPWLVIGYSQTAPSPLSGYAAVLGIYGIGFLVALLAALFAFGWQRKRSWGLLAGILAGGALLSTIHWTQPEGPPVKVSLLQGNVPQTLKWVPEHLPLSIDTYTRLAIENPATLTVLPETAIPLFFDKLPRKVLDDLRRHGDLLLGMAVRHQDGSYVNAALGIPGPVPPSPTFVAPAGEQLAGDAPPKTFRAQVYAKRHLVPFGEYAPPGFLWFFDLVNIPMADFSAGPAQQPLIELGGQKIAPNICYEDLFGEQLLDALPEATLLINLSNTAWFGDSLAQPQHLQIARMRAKETGRMMLRSTNTGVTAAIAPDGRVLAQLPQFTEGALVVEAQGFSGLTPYARWGNALALLLAIGACLTALLHAWRQRCYCAISGFR